MISRTGRRGGNQELPRVPYIEGDLSTMPGMMLEDLEAETDVTVIAQLANGMQYTLIGGTCKAGFENNTRDGQARAVGGTFLSGSFALTVI